MATYHVKGVDPPDVHFEKQNNQNSPQDIGAVSLFDRDADIQRFAATANAFIDQLENRRSLQDQFVQERDPSRLQELSQDLRTAERETALLRDRLNDHSQDLDDRFRTQPNHETSTLEDAHIRENEPRLREQVQRDQRSH